MKNTTSSGKQTRALEQAPPITTKALKRSLGEQTLDVCESTGIQNEEVASRVLCRAVTAQVWPSSTDNRLDLATAHIRELSPQNATEAMLAVQIIAAHEASLMFLRRSTLEDQPTEAVDANVLRATRLMRLSLQQIEAMQKLKGKASPQNLTVEQVNVHQGGQAIVGSVRSSKEGG